MRATRVDSSTQACVCSMARGHAIKSLFGGSGKSMFIVLCQVRAVLKQAPAQQEVRPP